MKFLQNENYKIKSFKKECPFNYMQKLLSLGFLPQVVFKIEKIAPFGDPIKIKIKDFSVSLRKSELNLMEVEKQ